MTLKRRSKKILLASELLMLEEADVIAQDKKYAIEFATDFAEELIFLKSAGKAEEKNADTSLDFEVPKKTLKKLHRKLALVTHPDHNSDAERFNDVQEAYESGDVSRMIAIAHDIGLDIHLTKEEIEHLEKQIQDKKKSLEGFKMRIRWVWCNSSKSKKFRKEVHKMLGIAQKDWEDWKSQMPKEQS